LNPKAVSLVLNISLVNQCLNHSNCEDCDFLNESPEEWCEIYSANFPSTSTTLTDIISNYKQLYKLANGVAVECRRWYNCISGCKYFSDDACFVINWSIQYSEFLHELSPKRR
jgi:hypothetical protein